MNYLIIHYRYQVFAKNSAFCAYLRPYRHMFEMAATLGLVSFDQVETYHREGQQEWQEVRGLSWNKPNLSQLDLSPHFSGQTEMMLAYFVWTVKFTNAQIVKLF